MPDASSHRAPCSFKPKTETGAEKSKPDSARGEPLGSEAGQAKGPVPTRPPQSAECGAPSAEAGVRPGAGDARCILTGGRTHGAVRLGVLEDAVTPGGLRSPPGPGRPSPTQAASAWDAPGTGQHPSTARLRSSRVPSAQSWQPCRPVGTVPRSEGPGARNPEQGPQSEGPGVRSGFCLGTACRRG